MNYYSYLVEHDYGLAPNPFGKYCTLAVCKPTIRKSSRLQLGDWIIGTGSKAMEDKTGKKLKEHLIYAMQVSEILSFEKYWTDPRFQYKKPVLNGPLVAMYGDNFYHKNKKGKWVQELSAHSNEDGSTNEKHLKIDTGGKNVLIGEQFYYFGNKAPSIPENLIAVCHTAIGQKKVNEKEGALLIKWMQQEYPIGIHGDPNNWVEYNQLQLYK